MSEEQQQNKPRASGEIQAEYVRVCARAGELQYRVNEQGKELAMLNSSIRDLNLEFAAASRFEEEVRKALASQEKKQAEAPPAEPVQPPRLVKEGESQ